MVSRGEIGNRHRNSLSNPSLVIIASVSHSALYLNCLLNVKVIENAFNQEKALVGAFSVIVKTDGALHSTSLQHYSWSGVK